MPSDRGVKIALALLVCWCLALGCLVGVDGGFMADSRGKPIPGDFIGIWAAGDLVTEGRPAAAYDWAAHGKAQQSALEMTDPNTPYYPWPYPPPFLAVAALLALLPVSFAMAVWIVATFGLYGVAAWRILGARPAILFMLAMPAVWMNAYIGQNGALSAALLGFGLALLTRSPVAAGVCIGLLAYKPHLGLLLPLALAAGGYWRAFRAATATVLAMALGSLALFGPEAWAAFADNIARVSALTAQTASPQKIQSLFGLGRAIGLEAGPAYAIQAMGAILCTLAIAWAWRNPSVSFDLKAALLAVAVTLTSPYLFVYDLPLLMVAQAFLVREAGPHGLAPAEIGGLIVANLLVLTFASTPLPLGIVGSLLILGLVLHRLVPELGMRGAVALVHRNTGVYHPTQGR